MITVYFDTNFYINLGRADDLVAASIIAKLNALEVRVVVSPVLITELFMNDEHQADDRRLVERLSVLLLEPLRIGGADFVVLLADEELRTRESARWRERREQMTIASSLATGVRQGRVPDLAALVTAHPETAAFADLPNIEDDDAKLASFQEHLALLFECNGFSMPPGLAEDPESWYANVMLEIRRVSGDAGLDAQLNVQAAQNSVLYRDPRLVDAGMGRAKAVASLARELGDAEHMGVFLQHSEQIDLIQVDGPQYRRILGHGHHVLNRRGLAARCFKAAGLAQAVAEVERLIAERRTTRASD